LFIQKRSWWIIYFSTGGYYGLRWGGNLLNEVPVPGDYNNYDRDGKIDIAVYRTSTGFWYIKPSIGLRRME
jgi:hypothetical protein